MPILFLLWLTLGGATALVVWTAFPDVHPYVGWLIVFAWAVPFVTAIVLVWRMRRRSRSPRWRKLATALFLIAFHAAVIIPAYALHWVDGSSLLRTAKTVTGIQPDTADDAPTSTEPAEPPPPPPPVAQAGSGSPAEPTDGGAPPPVEGDAAPTIPPTEVTIGDSPYAEACRRVSRNVLGSLDSFRDYRFLAATNQLAAIDVSDEGTFVHFWDVATHAHSKLRLPVTDVPLSAVIADPTGRFLLIAFDRGGVYRVEVTSQRIEQVRPREPFRFGALSPDGKTVVRSKGAGTSKLEFETLRTGSKRVVDGGLSFRSPPAFSADGQRLAVLFRDQRVEGVAVLELDGTLLKRFGRGQPSDRRDRVEFIANGGIRVTGAKVKYRRAAKRQTGRVPLVGPYPQIVDYAPDGSATRELYTALQAPLTLPDGRIWAHQTFWTQISKRRWRPDLLRIGRIHRAAFSVDATRLAIRHDPKLLSVFDAKRGRHLRSFIAEDTSAFGWIAGGRILRNASGGTIDLLDPDSGQTQKITTGLARPDDVSVSRDGQHIYVSNGSKVETMRASATALVPITLNTKNIAEVRALDDGSLAFLDTGANALMHFDPRSRSTTRIGARVQRSSSDGRWLTDETGVTRRSDGQRVWTVDVETHRPAFLYSPLRKWRAQINERHLRIWNTNTGPMTAMFSIGRRANVAAFSPDERAMVITMANAFDLCDMDAFERPLQPPSRDGLALVRNKPKNARVWPFAFEAKNSFVAQPKDARCAGHGRLKNAWPRAYVVGDACWVRDFDVPKRAYSALAKVAIDPNKNPFLVRVDAFGVRPDAPLNATEVLAFARAAYVENPSWLKKPTAELYSCTEIAGRLGPTFFRANSDTAEAKAFVGAVAPMLCGSRDGKVRWLKLTAGHENVALDHTFVIGDRLVLSFVQRWIL